MAHAMRMRFTQKARDALGPVENVGKVGEMEGMGVEVGGVDGGGKEGGAK